MTIRAQTGNSDIGLSVRWGLKGELTSARARLSTGGPADQTRKRAGRKRARRRLRSCTKRISPTTRVEPPARRVRSDGRFRGAIIRHPSRYPSSRAMASRSAASAVRKRAPGEVLAAGGRVLTSAESKDLNERLPLEATFMTSALTGTAPLEEVANKEKQLPRAFISADGFHITPACRTYLAPLIQGEAYPPFKHGLPEYVTLTNRAVPKKLHTDFAL